MKKKPFEIPILEDQRGLTVLDIALERHDFFKQKSSMFDRFWQVYDIVIH